MTLPAIPLDAAMTVAQVLDRLARYGLWRDAQHSAAAGILQEHARRLEEAGRPTTIADAEQRLRKDVHRMGAAIRREWHGQILWYARPAAFVLDRCLNAALTDSLLDALGLHEPDAQPPIPLSAGAPVGTGVVLDRGLPVAVNLPTAADGGTARAAPFPRGVGVPRNGGTRGGPAPARDTTAPPAAKETAAAAPAAVHAWPLLEAPPYTTAGVPFEVVVGLEDEQQAGVSGGPVSLTVAPGQTTIDLTVELIADGLDAPEGWSKPMAVAVADPAAARAKFTLVGRPPKNGSFQLTTIEARYLRGGSVCGAAARALEIRADGYVPPPALTHGLTWRAQPPVTSSMMSVQDEHVADLTIEIAKPDGNATKGRYVCRLYSPHPIKDRGPYDIDFGDDSKTFARRVVDEIRSFQGDPIVNKLLRAHGRLIAEHLPDAAQRALHDIAARLKRAPTVLIVSAEPYVPWEIAYLDPPLDAARPPFLGAQTVLGRWLRDGLDEAAAVRDATVPCPPLRVRKPPIQPPSAIPVRHMAVVAGAYQPGTGLQLPEADKEVTELGQTYDAVKLVASTPSLLLLLDARLEHNFKVIGGADAVHYAGHGDFNPHNPESAVMLLMDGRPLPSILFRDAEYGGHQQPLIFFNACMMGIGDNVLDAMGGFPGNCLKGGFGGVLGALWAVNDAVAREVALEFWKRALPQSGNAGDPIGQILHDLRAKYVAATPVPTYLAYVYYGHPQLRLQRLSV